MKNEIIIRGANCHNLRNVDLELPKDQLIVFTGVSGSGKSSLAFDTIFAEGQRRYVESLSTYARQFLGQLDKADVESIEGLSPAISIDQKTRTSNPRSTVGTITEIYDHLRLLYARIGTPYCPECGDEISPQSVDEIVDSIMTLAVGTKIQILSPVVRGKKGTFETLFSELKAEGFTRVRIEGKNYDLDEDEIKLKKTHKHNIEAIVDRISVKESAKSRIADGVQIALKKADGLVIIAITPSHPEESEAPLSRHPEKSEASLSRHPEKSEAPLSRHPEEEGEADRREDLTGQKRSSRRLAPQDDGLEITYSEKLSCNRCDLSFDELSPRLFSFNSPFGACEACHGLGSHLELSQHLIVPDGRKSIAKGAVYPWAKTGNNYYSDLLKCVCKHFKIDTEIPFKEIPKSYQDIILYGSAERILFEVDDFRRKFGRKSYYSSYKGVIPYLSKRFNESNSDLVRDEIKKYMTEKVCHACNGDRLAPFPLAVKINKKSIADVCNVSINDCYEFVSELFLTLSEYKMMIAEKLLTEIRERLKFLTDVGLGYLTLLRTAGTLSGGESQRIRLATQIGSGLSGVLYVLDEPSIGLHQVNNEKLLQTLVRLRNLGNTLIVVEHDEETMKMADYIVDIGPKAGVHGGRIVAKGSLDDIKNSGRSITGAYLNGKKKISIPETRKAGNGNFIEIKNAHKNNLKNIDVKIPLGTFNAITGVSGSGKSTLIFDLLHHWAIHELRGNTPKPQGVEEIKGFENIDKIIDIDQSPIGRTPRSNAATYTGVFSHIRELFSITNESKLRGYKPGRFSFNVKGGRCEHCKGDGVIKIEMNFLPDVYVPCDVCKGRRYNRETLEVKYKGKTIHDVLEMTVEEALRFFEPIPKISNRLKTLFEVGLDYIKLGQSATTLSGGEAQRIKLATELNRRSTGKTLYLLDEPSVGLHFYDLDKLLEILHKLVDTGNTVVVIEHNLDLIKTADHIIDLGPDGGDAGGEIIAQGTPEEIIKQKKSYTGHYLKDCLNP